jgi:hypothetical protein
MSRALAVLVLLLATTACSTDRPDALEPPGEQRHTASATVLESPQHGPELCVGGVEESYPPQCGGVPLIGWDWSQVDGEESANGTTWGDYTVTGRYDGTSLTLTEPPGPPASREPDGNDPIDTPCEAPAGGWRAEDPGRAGDQQLGETIGAARAQDEHAGAWVDDEDGTQVLTLAFTGSLPEHEARTRRTWGGALCVVQHERTLTELQGISDELFGGAAKELGLEPTFGSVSETENVVELGVVAATPEQVRAVAERYGEGVVRLSPALKPL